MDRGTVTVGPVRDEESVNQGCHGGDRIKK